MTSDGSTETCDLLILTGPPGSGKSTVAELVAGRLDRSVHVESDVFFHWISGGYVEPWLSQAHEQNAFVMGLVGDVAIEYSRAGYFTIVEGMLIPGWFLEPVTKKLRVVGLEVTTVVLRAPLDVCLDRAASRPSRPLHDPGVIEKLWGAFADLGDQERLVIDSGDKDADETADEVIRAISVSR